MNAYFGDSLPTKTDIALSITVAANRLQPSVKRNICDSVWYLWYRVFQNDANVLSKRQISKNVDKIYLDFQKKVVKVGKY